MRENNTFFSFLPTYIELQGDKIDTDGSTLHVKTWYTHASWLKSSNTFTQKLI